jgi:hypothetical protein
MSLLDTIDDAGDRGREFLQRITPRDRALGALLTSVLFLVFSFFVLSAMSGARAKTKLAIADAAQAQAQVNLLLADFAELSEEIEALDARLQAGASFSPATWLEKIGNEMGISANIKSMNEKGITETDYYRAQKLDLRVDDIDLKQVVDLTYRIENAEPVIRIDEIRIKTDRKDRSKLDVRMTISVLKPLEGAG